MSTGKIFGKDAERNPSLKGEVTFLETDVRRRFYDPYESTSRTRVSTRDRNNRKERQGMRVNAPQTFDELDCSPRTISNLCTPLGSKTFLGFPEPPNVFYKNFTTGLLSGGSFRNTQTSFDYIPLVPSHFDDIQNCCIVPRIVTKGDNDV